MTFHERIVILGTLIAPPQIYPWITASFSAIDP
jgi:hypothetical protein